jgi:hypothetical protein
MKLVKIVTVLLSLIALMTGAMDVIVGVSGQANIGVGAAAAAPIDPVLDSQVRFLGAIWLGFGAIQLVCLNDIRRYGTLLQLCYAITVIGGIGRVLSLLQIGWPTANVGPTFIIVALTFELLLVPLAWLALRKAFSATEKGLAR